MDNTENGNTMNAADLDDIFAGFEDIGEETPDTETPAAETAAETEAEKPEGQPGDHTGKDNVPDAKPAPETKAPEGTKQPDPSAEKYKVKYNGKEQELTIEELIANAQKGMNYDKVAKERDELRSGKEKAVVARLAELTGKQPEDIIAEIETRVYTDELKSKTGKDVDPEVAREYARVLSENKKNKEKEKAESEKETKLREFRELFDAVPTLREIPPEVMAEIKKGEKPINAYRDFENKQLRAELAAYKQKDENRRKATPRQKDDAPPDDGDAFLSGFDGI